MITANIWFKCTFVNYKEKIIIPHVKRFGLAEPKVDLDAPPLEAIANHGRWLVRCPCGGAEYAWEEGFFFCQSCNNEQFGHAIIRSVFPKERREIESALTDRPRRNKNWNPPETVGALLAENIIHVRELLPKKGVTHGMDNARR